MSMKKFMIFGIAILILFVSITLVSCERNNMGSEEASVNNFGLSETEEASVNNGLIEFGNMSTGRLTIYYFDITQPQRLPLSLEHLIGRWCDNTGRLIGGWYDYKVVVSYVPLFKQQGLFERLNTVELIPVENESRINARLYYVFEDSNGDEILSVLGFGRSLTMFVNGNEVEFDPVFLEVVLPFLPRSAVETIEVQLYNMRQE